MGKGLGRAAGTLCALAVVGVVALAGSIVAGATGSLPSTGNGIAPTSMDGSSIFAECSTALTGESHIFGLKAEKSGALATYNATYDKTNSAHSHGSDNPLSVTIRNAQVSGAVATFDWSANMPVDFVYVKAGAKATVYDYRAYGWGGRPASGPWRRHRARRAPRTRSRTCSSARSRSSVSRRRRCPRSRASTRGRSPSG